MAQKYITIHLTVDEAKQIKSALQGYHKDFKRAMEDQGASNDPNDNGLASMAHLSGRRAYGIIGAIEEELTMLD